MTRLVLFAALSGLVVGLLAAGDDPPKPLTPEERKQLVDRYSKLDAAGFKQLGEGNYPAAAKTFTEQLAVARRLYPKADFPNGHANLARAMNNLGLVLSNMGQLNDAEPLYRDALDMRKRVFKGDDTSVAQSLNNLAGLLRTRGKAEEAEQLYREALEMRRRLFKGDHPGVALCLNNLAGVLQDQRKFDDSEKLFREAVDMYRRLFKGDHPYVAGSMDNLALVLRDQGKLAGAESLHRDALAMRKRLHKGDHPAVALSLTNLASFLEADSKFTEAETLMRESLEMHRRIYKGDHPDVATTLSLFGVLLRDQGKLAEAEPFCREALAMSRRQFPGDHWHVAKHIHNLGNLYGSQGKFTEAEPLLRDSLAMHKRLAKGDHPELASCLNSLGCVLQGQRQYADAERFIRDSLAMNKRLFKGDHISIVMNLDCLATVLRDQGKSADAEPLLRETLAMNKRLTPGDHHHVAASLNNLGSLLHHRGNWQEAEPLLREAIRMEKRLKQEEHAGVVVSQMNLAILLYYQAKFDEAEPLFHDSLSIARRLIANYARQKAEGDALNLLASQPLLRDSFVTMSRKVKASAGHVYPEVWADKAALTRVYEQRQQSARAVTDPNAAKYLSELATARRRRAELLFAPEVKDPATRKQREDDLKELEKSIVDLDREIRPLLPTVERTERLAKSTPADLQKLLPADVAVVDFLRYTFFEDAERAPGEEREKHTPRYLAFVVTRGTVAWHDLDLADKVEPAVAAWREAIIGGKEIPAAVPAKVRELVWEKVRKELPASIKTVYIAPDVALCRVPWAALPGDKPGTILLEDFAIATIPHGGFLLDKLWPQDPIKNPPSGALVVGGVNYDAEATPGPSNRDLPLKPGAMIAWPALPGAAAESTGVESATKKKFPVTSLTGEKATPVAVLEALPKAKYAHFATHGFFADASFRSAFQLDPRDFDRTIKGERIGRAALSPLVMTGLVFAGANNPKTPGRGIVTGEALVDLDLSGLELAVLSACETGLGDVAGGEGTFGLQRAFHLAGTRDVIASLWKVPDQPTAALMAEFYRNLWEKNQTPLAALREAQLTIYRNPDKIKALAVGFRAGFKEVKGDDIAIKPTADGKTHPRLWAAFTLSGPGR